MKIPASPLLIAGFALSASTLAAPVARGNDGSYARDSSPSPNPDCGGFDNDKTASLPVARGNGADVVKRDGQQGPKSVMIPRGSGSMRGRNKVRRSRRAVSLSE